MKKITILLLGMIFIFNSCNKNKNPLSSVNGINVLASHNKIKVEQLAHSIDSNATLLLIKSNSVNVLGTSESWIYSYASINPTSYNIYYFHTTLTDVFYDSISNEGIIGIGLINEIWFDSDKALEIAEKNGGKNFRNLSPTYKIEASLSQPVVPNSSPHWYITYRSNTDSEQKLIMGIDATSQKISFIYP